MTGSSIMNKGKSILCIFLAAAVLAIPFRSQEVRVTAARTVAGEGMLRLVRDSMEHPRVALTFDDGPSAEYTPVLLEGLKEREVQASFFIMGKNIKGNEALLRQMQREGHLIGNHTYNHVQLNKIPRELACEEIQKTNNELYEATGIYPTYIRPPFGAWQENLELCVTMLPVFWDVDTLDWKSKNVNSILRIVQKEVKDGSIILMHDEYRTSVDAALKVVDMLLEKGYEFVTVDQMIVT